jgi:Uma2 family endonuclease
MANVLKETPPLELTTILDRPGWIPAELTETWDNNPYAYQTEEELMPAGGLHGQLLAYIVELLRHTLKERGLMLLLDVFLLYRDAQGVKQRIGPDLWLMPFRFPPPSAYDLDVEPPPLFIIEVTSPQSRLADLETKVPFYLNLGVSLYLVLDAITAQGQPRQHFQLHAWRLVGGRPQKIRPDSQGSLILSDVELKVMARGQRLSFMDTVTGELLFDMEQLMVALQSERQARWGEHQARLEAEARAEAETQRAEAEAEARRAAEAEIARLRDLLAKKENG